MSLTLTKSVVLITSDADKNDRFGTGFVIRRTGVFTYVITCDHVIQEVGTDSICINGLPGILVVTGEHLGLDLAVVKVEGLTDDTDPVFQVSTVDFVSTDFITEGFQIFDSRTKTHMKRVLQGSFAEPFEVTAQAPNHPIRALELRFQDGDNVQPGYSGSPILDGHTEKVIGVMSHRLREGVGAAISIEELNRIWQPVERQELRESLLNLGYRSQSRLFRQLVEQKPIGAYLIHGPTENYGQQWLVNRLLQQYVPSSLTGKKFRISLNRVGRRGDVDGLWAELAIELKCDRNTKPQDIAKRALRWWKSQDVIIAIYDVDCLSEELLNHLIQDFWLPLANGAEGMRSQGNPHNLLLFLIDNEAVTAQQNIPFTEKIDANSATYYPIKSPQNEAFSKNELTDWMEDTRARLPREMIAQTDKTVDDMYDLSDEGVPEWIFVEICKRCGYDWRTELSKWCPI
ncbi:MAG: trypsin-like peptidase domain-containing protein [Cyanobacteria bacterium J06648_10]